VTKRELILDVFIRKDLERHRRARRLENAIGVIAVILIAVFCFAAGFQLGLSSQPTPVRGREAGSPASFFGREK
jgi:hypothetical protein